jgi:hypothetical protein
VPGCGASNSSLMRPAHTHGPLELRGLVPADSPQFYYCPLSPMCYGHTPWASRPWRCCMDSVASQPPGTVGHELGSRAPLQVADLPTPEEVFKVPKAGPQGAGHARARPQPGRARRVHRQRRMAARAVERRHARPYREVRPPERVVARGAGRTASPRPARRWSRWSSVIAATRPRSWWCITASRRGRRRIPAALGGRAASAS